MKRAVFLDRDGVITQEPPHYAYRLYQLKLIPRSTEAIKLLNENNFDVIIVSNQSGIARGYYGEEDMMRFNSAMNELLNKSDAHIDSIYYCPHHPEAKIERYRKDCDCRKPRPGMLKRAEEELNINLKQSFMVGDRWSDIEAAKRVECKTILVRTGYDSQKLKGNEIICDYVANDLYEAVEYILFLSW